MQGLWNLIYALFISLGIGTLAYSEEPRKFHVSTDVPGLSLNPYLEFFEDQNHSQTIEKILHPMASPEFFRSDKNVLTFGFSKSIWWSRLSLENPSQEARSLYILQHYPLIDEIEFFSVIEGRVAQRFLSGDMGQRQESDPIYRAPLFKMEVPPGGAMLYIKARSKGPINFELFAYSEKRFHNHHKNEYIFLYVMVCIILVMAIYNFLIYLQLKKTVYLIYVAFLFTMMAQPMSYSGLFIEWLPNLPFLVNEGYLLCGNASSFLACLYPIYFLSLRGRHPWLMRICIFGLILTTCSTMSALFLPYEMTGKLAAVCSLFASFATLSCGVTCSIKGYRPAYFFTAAWLFLIVANGIRILTALSILPWSFFTEWGTLIGTVLEVVLLSLGLSDKVRITEKVAFERIEKLNSDLQKEHSQVIALNENLEERVEEQTREVKSILHHIQMGILLAKGDDLLITPAYSDYTKVIFHNQKLEGQNLVDFIFKATRVNDEQKDQVRSLLSSCINEDVISTQLNLHALPIEIECFHDGERQLLQIDWNPVVNAEGLVEKMLVTVKDVTLLKRLESDAEEKSRELAYIGEILEVPSASFDRFIDSSQKFLAENERLIKVNMKYNSEALKILFINLHTIKGVARSLGLKHLTPSVHGAEQSLAAVMKREKAWNQAQLLSELQIVKNFLDRYQLLSQEKLGRSRSAQLAITQHYAESLIRFFGQVESLDHAELRLAARPLRQAVEELILVRAETIFREVFAGAGMLARDLNREIPKLEINDGGIHLTPQGQDLIRHSFIHIVRNSMDHGIETAAERVAKGKQAEGTIRVLLELAKDQLIIHYSDDGAGLNMGALRRVALKKGLMREEDQLSLLDTAYLIFEPGFSTSCVTSDISGRGVGMSAVREYCERAGGSVRIAFPPGSAASTSDFQAFQFEFMLPSSCFDASHAERPIDLMSAV